MSLWTPNTFYKLGDVVIYQNISYKCQIAHTAIVSWEPISTPALWIKQESVTQPPITQPPVVTQSPVTQPQIVVCPPTNLLPPNTQTINFNQNNTNSHIFSVNIDIDFI